MIQKNATACCALCHITCNDDDSLEELKAQIETLKKEADSRIWYGTGPDEGGQRAAFVITTQHELNLQKNLRKLGFVIAYSFKRRTGYPKGTLTMWILSW